MNNAQRAERVAEALRGMYEEGDLIEQSLGDLMCDIRHLCDREGIEFERVNFSGWVLHAEEVEEEQFDQSQTK